MYKPMWSAYASQQSSCDAVPLVCGGLAVKGRSPYSCAHKSANLYNSVANTLARKGGATLATAYMQPEHSKTLGSFDLRFGLCFFHNMFWSCWVLCLHSCKLMQNFCKYTYQKGWGHLGHSINAT